MTVINPSSISGITSITMPSGDGNVLTIHTNDGIERFRIDSSGNVKVGSACTISQDGDVFFTGVTTATTFTGAHSGSGANLTSLPAAQLTGALPAISGANLTGIAATDNVRTGILDVAGISTFRNTMNVGAAVTISESGIEASGIGITVANINGGQISGRRNFIINGAMQVAEHSDSNAGVHNTYAVDRLLLKRENTGANFTMSQSTTSPDGFSHSLKMDCTVADTSTAATEFVVLKYNIEGQDVQHLAYGTSAAKTLVLSFYVRSNLTGTYSISCVQPDNSNKIYAQTYTINSADTWERKIISIPADGSGVINDDNGTGFQLNFGLILGSTYKGAGVSPTWESYTNARFGSQHGVNLGSSTSNEWYLTGLQLEVGPEATAFEHRSFAEELALCQRYFYKMTGNNDDMAAIGFAASSSDNYFNVEFPVPMRDYPTLTGSATAARFYSANVGQDFNLNSLSLSSNMTNANPKRVMLYVDQGGTSGGYGGVLHFQEASGFLEFSAEL